MAHQAAVQGLIWLAVVLLLLPAACQARKCSPCPFQWSSGHQLRHCYRYFDDERLSRDGARSRCRGLWPVGLPDAVEVVSADEAVFTMGYVAAILGGVSPFADEPGYVWLGVDERIVTTSTEPESVLIYTNTLAAEDNALLYSGSCDYLVQPSVSFSGSSAVYYTVTAPGVVDSPCASYAEKGTYADLGNFANKCVSDPDLCDSGGATWSVWLRIDKPEQNLTGDSYVLSTGGQSTSCQGVYVVRKPHVFEIGYRSDNNCTYTDIPFASVPEDAWFHLTFLADISGGNLEVFIDASRVGGPKHSCETGPSDACTWLTLGASTPNDPADGISAAYSHLQIFNGLLEEQEITYLHNCGTPDWGLKIRSLHMDPASAYSPSKRYVCKASVSTGPTIHWRVYHADQAQWEDLDPSIGPSVNITPTSLSACVLESVLTIDGSLGPSSVGDVISCTAMSGSDTASVYIWPGNGLNMAYSDHDSTGVFITNASEQYYHSTSARSPIPDESYPFICKKEPRF